ncbi:MAG: hypothetical protein OEO20_00220 [Gemmatimonadota bacterium]|nr:hypothetical protein [Gemmatimonadota bacterium]MDH3367116.1 hypothetical protein [Gemmatimonadota bacterium]MDH3476712.1 hypothetical protein [Gemmatimonadota bacterium]MDH5549638.1 hypothetical protein [Gemmatimonadota bacterium]
MSLHHRLTLPTVTLFVALLGPLAVARAQEAPAPCLDGGAYDQFDFWVGEWDVFTPDGVRAGSNRIEKVAAGCLLVEHWTSAAGGTGNSLNYYHPARQQWIQVWVDGQGGVIEVAGEFTDGAMRFVGEHVYPDGRREAFRMRFTPQVDGSVRQFIEQSKDEGATWYVWFDGRYERTGRPDTGEPRE